MARRRIRVSSVLAALLCAALAAMWVYAFVFAPRDNPDKVGDVAWVARTEVICAKAKAALNQLPTAQSFAKVEPKSEGLRQRSGVGDQANEILRAMVAEVAATRPTDDSGQRAVALWVQDWASLQASRERQVAKWKSGIDEPFEEALSEKRAPISNRMGQFARGNRMDSCQPAGDMG